MQNNIIKIKGMHCASCALGIEKDLKKHPGIKKAHVNFATQSANVNYDENSIKKEGIEKIIIDNGYTISRENSNELILENKKKQETEKKQKTNIIIAIILTLPLFLRMFWAWEIPGIILNISNTLWIQIIFAFIVVFYFGSSFHKNAFKQIIKGKTSMDTLISVGTLTAFFFSLWAIKNNMHYYFESAATITSLILLGKYLELKSKNRASRAMEKLMELGVKMARVITNKEGKEIEKEIEVDQVDIDQIILVKPSEKIPLDGIVLEGISNVDEAMLTGESMPITKEIKSKVFAGTINKDGILKIKVTKKNNESVLSQIIKTVEEAQNFKAPMQRLADKIAGIFVPVVIGIAILTFLGWYFIGGNLTAGIINAITVLIISCPCALGIATPIAVMVGTSTGAKNGILIKDGESFERAKKIDTVVFDKTGTLTKGKPEVQKIYLNSKLDFKEEAIIKIASSLTRQSEHPLSKAVTKYGKNKNITHVKLENFKEFPGRGVSGTCKEHKVKLLLGNKKLMEENKINISWLKELEQNENINGTILSVSHGQNIIGAILLADELKDNAIETIKEIINMGLEPIMISGDNKQATSFIAQKLNIKKYFAETLPKDKQDKIKELQANNKKVIFVGDGINDAPSLIQADLGIAMGDGTDIAKESGSIIIMQDDPLKIVEAIKLSKKTFSVIKQNLFWAFFYNVLAIPLAIFGLVNPMVGALAMGFSDVTVIGNSLRIYKKKK